jgi:hypothetical protein
MMSTRPTRPLPRSLTSAVLAALTVLPLIGCAQQSTSTPSTAVSSTAVTVSPTCLTAMREALDGALYQPNADEVSQLPECRSESEEAIGAAAERLLRETFDTTQSPSPAP